MPAQIVRTEVRGDVPYEVTYEEVSAVELTDTIKMQSILASYGLESSQINEAITEMTSEGLL